MADVRDIVTEALLEIGVLSQGETPSAGDAASALSALNRLVDSWAAESLAIYEAGRTTWAITTSTRDYTVGTGGTINRAFPVWVDGVRYYSSATTPVTEIPLTLLTNEAWAAVAQKTATAETPSCAYYNRTWPLGTLSLWPTPTSTTLIGVLYAPMQVTEFASLSTAVSLPPGYRRLLVKGLATEIAGSYGAPVSPELKAQATDAKAVVKRANTRQRDMRFDGGALVQGSHAYDILTG